MSGEALPALGRNNLIGDPGLLDFYLFSWPTSPSRLYALTQGLHVTIGIALLSARRRAQTSAARPPGVRRR